MDRWQKFSQAIHHRSEHRSADRWLAPVDAFAITFAMSLGLTRPCVFAVDDQLERYRLLIEHGAQAGCDAHAPREVFSIGQAAGAAGSCIQYDLPRRLLRHTAFTNDDCIQSRGMGPVDVTRRIALPKVADTEKVP